MNTMTKQDWKELDTLYSGMESGVISWCIAVSHFEDKQDDIADRYGIDQSSISMMKKIGENSDLFFVKNKLIKNLPSGFQPLYHLISIGSEEIKKLCADRVPTVKRIRDLKTELGLLPAPKVKPAVTSAAIEQGLDPIKTHIVESLPQGTSKTVINKVRKGMDKLAGDMKKEFSTAVNKEVEQKTKVRHENMRAAEEKANDAYERTIKMKAGVKAFMTKKEFMTVRACLHPDKNPHPKAAEAFKIFNRLADVKNW